MSLSSFDSGAAILRNSYETSISLARSWDEIWYFVLNSPLYVLCSRLGALLAVLFMGLAIMDFIRQSNYAKNFDLNRFVVPLLVAILISGNGTVLRGFSFGYRSFLNAVEVNSLTYLSETSRNMSTSLLFRRARTLTQLRDYLAMEVTSCYGRPPAEMSVCLDDLRELYQGFVSQLEEDSSNYGVALTDAEKDQVFAPIEDARRTLVQSSEVSPDSEVKPSSNYNWIAAVLRAVIVAVLYVIQNVIGHASELSMLLTALVAPIMFGSALFPVGQNNALTWAVAFSSLGVFKISYSITVGLVCLLLERSRSLMSLDSLFLPVFVAVASPILAGALALGGGMAVFNAIQSSISGAASAAATGAVGAVGVAGKLGTSLVKFAGSKISSLMDKKK